MSRLRFFVAIGSSLASLCPAATSAAESLKRTGTRFQLECHIQNEKIADEAIQTLDAAWPIIATAYKVEDKSAKTLPIVHLYSSVADYEKAEQALTGGKFRENLAFAHYASNSGHVVLQPPCSEEVLDSVGLPEMTRRLLAHEAVHLAGHALVDQYATLPQWIIDGAATSIDQIVMEELGASESAESDPFCSTFMQRAKDLSKNKKLPSVSDIVSGKLDDLSPIDRYGVRWLCYEFIRKGVGEDQWGAAIKQNVKEPRAKSIRDVVKSFLTSKEPADERFVKYIKKLKPQWDQVFRSLEPDGAKWQQVAFPEKNAICWKTRGVKNETFEITGQARIFPGSSHQFNLLLGRSDEGFISIAMLADYGVTVLRYKSKADEWSTLADAKCDGLASGKSFKFTARYEEGDLVVSIGKKEVVRATVEHTLVAGPWGLGAQAGTAGTWSKVVCVTGKNKGKKSVGD